MKIDAVATNDIDYVPSVSDVSDPRALTVTPPMAAQTSQNSVSAAGVAVQPDNGGGISRYAVLDIGSLTSYIRIDGQNLKIYSSNYVAGSAGWAILSDGSAEFNNGVFRGALTAATIDIGGADATSFHVDINGNMWLGAATFNIATNPFSVTNAGIVRATGAIISGAITATSGSITGSFSVLANLSVGTAGSFSSGQTAYDTGTGWWFEYNSGTPRISVGNSAGNKITWDGTTLTITGTLVASAGSIGGFNIGADYIRDAANSFGLASTVTGGDDVRFWAGATFAARATAPARITEAGVATFISGTIGGWTLAATTLTATSIILDAGNQKITVGSGSPNIVIDGANNLVGTSTFVSGQSGWQITGAGNAEFNNIIARGEMRTTVFVKDEIHATGGTMLVLSAGVLKANVVTVDSPTTFTMDITDPPSGHAQLFSVNDIVRIKDGSGKDNWIKITVVSDQTTFYRYTCVKQNGTAGTFYIGTAVLNYKQSTDGFVLMTSDLSNAPYIDIGTNGATPWSGTTAKARLGNLAGITDAIFGVLSGYGLWTSTGYFTGSIFATAGYFGDATTRVAIEAAGINIGTTGSIRAGQTAYDTGTGFWIGQVTGTPKLSLGNSAGNKVTWDGTTLSVTGAITATSGSITGAFSVLNSLSIGTAGNIKSGQTAYNVGAGWFLEYNGGTPRFSLGDGTIANSLTWDGSTLLVNGSALAGQIIYGDGSDGTVTISGDVTLSRDMFYNDLTINDTKTLNVNGWRIFVKGTLTLNATTATISGKGGNGGNASAGNNGAANGNGGSGGAGGSGGTGWANGSIAGSLAGPAGQGGANSGNASPALGGNGGNGTAGAAKSKVFIAAGVVGAAGGNGGNGQGGGAAAGGSASTGGGAGAATLNVNNSLHNVIAAYSLWERDGAATAAIVIPNTVSGGSGSGGGGGCAGGGNGGGGGGGGGAGGTGAAGGIVQIFAKKIVNNGIITVAGGAGGNGADGGTGFGTGAAAGGGGGGGGASGSGGNGGLLFLVYGSYSGSGTKIVSGGAAGATKGLGGSPGVGGSGGGDGSLGTAGAAGLEVDLIV